MSPGQAPARVSYLSEQAALDRVEALKMYGIWPGIRIFRDEAGNPKAFALTFDPGDIQLWAGRGPKPR